MEQTNISALYFSKKLKSRLGEILTHPFTFIEAPMGYGKTTAVRETLKNADCTVLWQTVFGAGNSHFWPDFCDAFLPLCAELTVSLRKIGFPIDIIHIRQAVELIRDVNKPNETVLVIDDYHYVKSPNADNFFTYLLANIPNKLHIVILSRTAFFKADVSEMKLKGMVNYIDTDMFKLDINDIGEYCKLCGVNVSEKERERLYRYSEGWITPLYLSMREYVQTGRFTAISEVNVLIRKIVYNALPDEIKDFLSHVCLFDNFTLKQASFMWQRPNAEALIEELMRSNVFITLDASGRYSFHNLFMIHLLAAFDKLNERERNDIHKRAGEYFMSAGNTMGAMESFGKAGETALQLVAFAKRNGADLTGEHREKIIDCLDNCSDAQLSQNLAAVLAFIRFMISYNEEPRLNRCISIFESNIGGYRGSDKTAMLVNFERFLGLSKYNDIAKMSVHHRKALEYMEKPSHMGKPFTGEENVGNWTFGSHSVLMLFHRESGKLKEELEQMRACMPIYRKLTDGHGSGAEFVMEAEAAFFAGDFIQAEAIIHKAQYFAREKRQWSILLSAEFLRMRLALAYGDWFEIINIQRQMADLMEANMQYLLQHTFDICASYISLLLNRPDDVADWISDGDFTKTRLMFPAMPGLHMVYGQYLLKKGEYAKLCGFAEIARQTSSVYPNILGIIYADIYKSAAYHKLSRKDEAILSLKNALDLAIPDSLLIPFACNGDYLAEPLAELSNDIRYAESIARILAMHKDFAHTKKKILREHFTPGTCVLNERELEVARLAAQGLSNRQIGAKLFLSEGGVKSRLKTVFEKLSVTSRKQLSDALK